MSQSEQFVHLNLHSEYSLVDGIVRVPELAEHLVANSIPAVALTDVNNLFAAVKFYNAMLSRGIKPLIGADLELAVEGNACAVTMLCQNERGYVNLCELISQAYTRGQSRGLLRVEPEWIMEKNDGLIVVSNACTGLYHSDFMKSKHAPSGLDSWLQAFQDRFYLSISRVGRKHENSANNAACRTAASLGLPLVAVNDVRFLHQDDFNAHEVRVAIHDGYTLDDKARPRKYTRQQYLRSGTEMAQLFSDVPSAIQNTFELAKRCNLEIRQGNPVLPAFPVPAGQSTDEFLITESERRLDIKLREIFTDEEYSKLQATGKLQDYRERLHTELDVILGMGFPGYFLIVADFIQWAKQNAIPVGPGRGSGAGSLVAFVLGITDLNPLDYDLLFERFLNPERVSMPDFDIDFCIDGRDRVIDYVAEKYGRDHVSQIITFGTMAAKAVVRDVARVQGHSYGFADRIAKLIPFVVGMTLEKAMDQEAELKRLYQEDEEVTALLDMAMRLEGIARNAGKHAGGIVIAPNKLTDFMPLFCEEGGQDHPVCQFDKDDAEKIGLVKFDFLGLKTLTIIDNAVKLIEADVQFGTPSLDIAKLKPDDPAVYEFLSSGKTKAIFQLESGGMQKLIKELEPSTFDDVIALLALYRPGPLNAGMHHTFVARRHEREQVEYPHPMLAQILKPTYGVILYQEQVMQIAQHMAGYSLGGADLLRRAMGKKKKEEMVKQREIFLQGADKNGVDAKTANYVFDLMEKFADYGFNKSHSAAYALISYQTAWLKHYYPAHFMAAVLSADMDHTDKLVGLKDDCKQFSLKLEAPSVNASEYRFTVADSNTINYGLGAIKGVGYSVIQAVLDERNAHGEYTDILDFCRRCAHAKLSRRTYEALIKSGALDCLGMHRAGLIANLDAAIKYGKQTLENSSSGIDDLFGFAGSASRSSHAAPIKLDQVTAWKQNELLAAEKSSLGLYLSGHPVDIVSEELRNMTGRDLKAVKEDAATYIPGTVNENTYQKKSSMTAVVAGLVVDFRKRGNRVSLVLDDNTERIEVGLFEKEYDQYRHIISKDRILVVSGKIAFDDYLNDYKLTADKVLDLEQARDQYAGRLVINCDMATLATSDQHLLAGLKSSLEPHLNGNCRVKLVYRNSSSQAALQFGAAWKVKPNRLMVENLQKLFGKENVRIQYQRNITDRLTGTD